MFGSKTPFGSGGFGSTNSAFGAQQSTPFGGSSTGGGNLWFIWNLFEMNFFDSLEKSFILF